MNWRHTVGSLINVSIHRILKSLPLIRFIPYGFFWEYDVQRFSGGKTAANAIFDVGANIGQSACGFVHYWPGANLYCFEPVSTTMDILKERYSRFEKIRFVKSALGATVEHKEIQLHQNSELNTLVDCQPRTGDFTGGTERIDVITLDAFCSDNQISEIDILKIDVQGWELKVLKGASNLLVERRIHFIYAEVCFSKHDRDMQYFSELNEFLQENNFVFCGFYGDFRWGARKQFLGFTNALYVERDYDATIE